MADDAGLVYPPGRKPYALTVLTEWEAGVVSNRMQAIARVTRVEHEALVQTR